MFCIEFATINGLEESESGEDASYSSISKVQSTQKQAILSEQPYKILHVGLATAKQTLEVTTHKCIQTTGLLTKRFKTDCSQSIYN